MRRCGLVGLLRQLPPMTGYVLEDTFSLRVAGARSTLDALDRLDPILITSGCHGPHPTCGQARIRTTVS